MDTFYSVVVPGYLVVINTNPAQICENHDLRVTKCQAKLQNDYSLILVV